MTKRYGPGIILIFIGILLLLDEAAVISLRWADFFSYGLLLIGIMMLLNGSERPDRRGVLGGTFFVCFGLALTLMRNRILIRDDEFGAAVLFLSLALANLVYFMVNGYRWPNFTWAVIFAVIGSLVLISFYGYYPSWYIYDLLERYWPLILILIGLSILFRGLKKQRAIT
jgi:hypothetical protein